MNDFKKDDLLLQKLFGKTLQNEDSEKYKYLGIQLNPFPRSGTSNINSGDYYNSILVPIDSTASKSLIEFISSALSENTLNPNDKFISATVVGDYGSGKTQFLMYAKFLLNYIASTPDRKENPYVIYIDNPGINLLEFIGIIISKIGEENLRKYLWENIINIIKRTPELKEQLKPFTAQQSTLFSDINTDPFIQENTISYKKFLDTFVRYIASTQQRKNFDIAFKNVIMKVLEAETEDSTVSYYFYEFISSDFGINKTWEALTSGTLRQLNGKEANIIRYIVNLIKKQGFSDFFILVDEFEDITEGRLTKGQIDNYVYNLRTLLDEHREWCLIFSMTLLALKKLKSVSPPLADRISSRIIQLQSLSKEQAINVVKNYMKMAGLKKSDSIGPFTEDAIDFLRTKVEGNTRRFLKVSFALVEKAASSFNSENDKINLAFVKENIISIEQE